MTIHYASVFKGRADGPTVPLCMQFAMRQTWGATTTTDATEVECVRCAKALGVRPKAKPASTTLRGTCPCCFRDQATAKLDRIVNHGYQRPGHGYLIGKCFGVGFPKFEKSPEGTIALHDHLAGIVEGLRARLADAAADRIESLTFTYERPAPADPATGSIPRDSSGRRLMRPVFVTVPKGAPAGERSFAPDAPPRTPAFATLLDKLVSELARDADALDRDIAHLAEKIEGWKPAA